MNALAPRMTKQENNSFRDETYAADLRLAITRADELVVRISEERRPQGIPVNFVYELLLPDGKGAGKQLAAMSVDLTEIVSNAPSHRLDFMQHQIIQFHKSRDRVGTKGAS